MVHELAGKRSPPELLVNVPRLVTAYFALKPDAGIKEERIAFGTSGHRGSSTSATFNEDHIAAVTQAVCDYRARQGVTGPLYIGMDTHALSEAALATTLEVLAANRVTTMLQQGMGYTPTPAISHAILTHNRDAARAKADGIVLTPSHNPPDDGGLKYNPPSGGPADTDATGWIEARANDLLEANLRGVNRIPLRRALAAETTIEHDYVGPYVSDLGNVIDMDAIADAGVSIGADPLGGAGVGYWDPIADRYGLNLEVVNPKVDPTFSFMTVDKDGKIRMDCSSPYAMARLIELKERFDIAFGNDPDFDRHGIVTRSGGLMNPNHYLSVAVDYLFSRRQGWQGDAAVGKTLVSSSMIDRVAARLGRRVAEVPVGFKWFVSGLLLGSYGIGAEESAGASFLRKDGSVWTTDKDGIILNLLAAEICAVTEMSPEEHYRRLEDEFGSPAYVRLDAPATREQKAILKDFTPELIDADEFAGEAVLQVLTRAPENNAAIGGIKVVTKNGWFAARPSGTEDIYKIYAESFAGQDHLDRIVEQAQAIVNGAFEKAP